MAVPYFVQIKKIPKILLMIKKDLLGFKNLIGLGIIIKKI